MENGTPKATEANIRMSPTIGAIVAALAKAQRKLINPERNRSVTVRTKTGGSYEFSYATLDAILDQARPILVAEEIALLQGVQSGQNAIAVSTMLAHSSGEWVESTVRFPAPSGPQEVGSLITYGRRYTLTGLLGIAAEEDDDANSAAGNSATDVAKARPKGEPRVVRDPVPEGIPAWQGTVVNFKRASGQNKTTGKEWTRYTLVGSDGEEFSTFSESAMKVAKNAPRGVEFQVVYEEDPKYKTKTIVEIKPLDAPDDDEIAF